MVKVSRENHLDIYTVWCCLAVHIQSDQTVSVHLKITKQKVTSNVQSVLRQSPDNLLTGRTVFSKIVFSIARSIFRVCSVMAIFTSSVVLGLFEYTELGAQRLYDDYVHYAVTLNNSAVYPSTQTHTLQMCLICLTLWGRNYFFFNFSTHCI